MMEATRQFLEGIGLPPGDLHALPSSTKRFPDGAQYRVEIPSTESPDALAAVIEEADHYQITVHQISQGSGVLLLTDEEIRDMGLLARARGMEVSLFARPHAGWDIGAMAVSSNGKTVSPRLHGQDQLLYCLEDVQRAATLGIRSVLLADEGALWIAGEMRQAVDIPLDIYVEAPDDLGGFVRFYDIPELVRIAAPVYLKFGLRNALNIYPIGKHL